MSRRRSNGSAFSLFAFQDIITSVIGIIILVTMVMALELVKSVESSPSQRTNKVVGDIKGTVASVKDLKDMVSINQDLINKLTGQLQQGAATIGEMAGFDANGVGRDQTNLDLINKKMADDLAELEKDHATVNHQRQKLEDEFGKPSNDPKRIQEKLDEVEKTKKDLEAIRKSKRVIFNPTEGDAKTPWLIEVTADAIIVAKIGVTAPPSRLNGLEDFRRWAAQRNRNTEYFVLMVKPNGIEVFQQLKSTLERLKFDIGYDLLSADQTAIDPNKGAAAQ